MRSALPSTVAGQSSDGQRMRDRGDRSRSMMTGQPGHSAKSHHESFSFISRWMWLGAGGFVAVSLLAAAAIERKAARRERASFERLCAMGATGDDWVSFRELLTGSPPIVQLHDWYLVQELENFRSGARGAHPDDVWGATMRVNAVLLSDQAMRDVIAYVQTLR